MIPFIAIVSLVVFFVYGLRPFQRWKYRHIPGPPPRWLFGNLFEIIKRGKHEAFFEWSKSYGGVYKILEGGVVSVVVNDAKLGRYIAARMPNRHDIPFLETGEDAKLNAAGILFARGVHHRGLRAAWQPMFHSGSMQGFHDIMISAADKLMSILEDAAECGRPVDVWRRLGDFTMQISGTTAFGVDIPAQDSIADDGASSMLVKSAKSFFDAAGQIEGIYALLQVAFPGMEPAVRYLASVLPTPTYASGLKGRHQVQEKVTELLLHHRKATPKGVVGAVNGKSGVAPGSFLDLMARAENKESGEPFNDLEVVCQAFSFVMAAYETTTASLAFAIYLLATHPDKEAKMLTEIDAFGCDRVPTWDDITDGKTFTYVDAVFKETLRLYPPVPIAIREADKDLELTTETHKYSISKGTHMAICIYGMHRSCEYWEKPEEFSPERFLSFPSPSAYMPFGDGPRGCIGQRYAWQEAMIAMIRLYQKFTFKLSPGQVPLRVRMSLSLTPLNGVMVHAQKRAAGS